MRIFLIALLGGVLATVYWLGARVYSEDIEHDISTRTQQEIDQHRGGASSITRVVDGRDVTLRGIVGSEDSRSTAGHDTRGVWGVRVLENEIVVAEPVEEPIEEPAEDIYASTGYNLYAEHNFPDLRVIGGVDEPTYNTVSNIHQALPPEAYIDYSGLQIDAPELQRSARIVETGIAAVTQLNPGTLTITDSQFILDGVVYSDDRKLTIEQLIDVRRAEIAPLEIITNIRVESNGITQACRDGIDQVLANNVMNYAVDHYKIIDTHATTLAPMTATIQGVCQGQIETVLVESHADYTGGAGYNQGLSERRSGTVRDYLIEQGIDPNLINAFGYGEFRPIASNETIDGRALNRRTEIYLLLQGQAAHDVVPTLSYSEE